MITNKPTTLIIKDRATGQNYTITLYECYNTVSDYCKKSFTDQAIIRQSKRSWLNYSSTYDVEECKNKRGMNYDHVLIDEGYNLIGEALDAYMGTHVMAVTLTDRVKELADKKVVRL